MSDDYSNTTWRKNSRRKGVVFWMVAAISGLNGGVFLGQFSQAMTEIEKNLGKMAEEIVRLKRYVVSLEEENVRLKRQLFAVSETEIERVQSNARRIQLEAQENLEKMYREGFHVCHFYFGEPLEEGCLFCSAFLQHERT